MQYCRAGAANPRQKGQTTMDIKPGMKFKGIVNNAVFVIVKADKKIVTYKDVTSGKIFTVGRKMFDHLDIAEIEE